MFAATFALIATRAERGRRSWRAYPKYGIAAVTRAAEARFKASTISSTSIRLSFAGAQVDWSTKQSLPRTFSRSSTMISPSENLPTVAWPSGMLNLRTTACASSGLAFPVKTIRLS